jgi:hypothetical protein
MSGSYKVLDCPICSSRMSVPERGGKAVYTCRNGHRFVWGGAPRRPFRLPVPGPILALAISVLLIVLFVAARHWPGQLPLIIRVG